MSLPFSVGMRSRLRADIQSAEVGKYREMSWRISFGRFVGNKESGAEDFQSYPLTSPYFFSPLLLNWCRRNFCQIPSEVQFS